MHERLQKIISAAGLMSRRAAERCISEGRVTVNGAVAEIGMSADPLYDDIRLDGESVTPSGEMVYIMLNKPRGYITTMSDDRGRKTVTELISGVGVRLYPVGRLDKDSEGLLLMTNDGAVAKKLMQPSHNVWKTYRVWVRGDIKAVLPALRGDFEIDGRVIRAKDVHLVEAEKGGGTADITIGEGRNRQVRRMCAAVNLRVVRLVRTGEGELRLGGLQSGGWRYLSDEEKSYLKSIV